MDERIWIGCDHGGYELKTRLLEYFRNENIEFKDVGCNSTEIVRYPYFAAEVASRISKGEIHKGILICSTGIGMSIIANKYPGVRASLCHTVYEARMTRQHNNSNCLCFGGRIIGDFQAIELVKAWLGGVYEGGRHDISLGLIAEAERVNLSGKCWVNTAPLK